MVDAGFNFLCDPVDYSNNPKALRVRESLVYMFYVFAWTGFVVVDVSLLVQLLLKIC